MPTTKIMAEAEMDAKVRRWGHSMGLVIPMDVARRLNLRPGDMIHVRVEQVPEKNNADRLPKWEFTADYDIDEILEEEFVKDHLGEKEGSPTD